MYRFVNTGSFDSVIFHTAGKNKNELTSDCRSYLIKTSTTKKGTAIYSNTLEAKNM